MKVREKRTIQDGKSNRMGKELAPQQEKVKGRRMILKSSKTLCTSTRKALISTSIT